MISCECEGDIALLDSRTITARKVHICCECGKEIQPGEQYEKARWADLLGARSWFFGDEVPWEEVDYKAIDTLKTCLFCMKVRDDMFEAGFCISLGGLWDDIECMEEDAELVAI